MGTRSRSGAPLQWTPSKDEAVIKAIRDRRKVRRSQACRKLVPALRNEGILNENTGKPFHHSTVLAKRKKLGFRGKKQRSRPRLTKKHMENRFVWATKNQHRVWKAGDERGRDKGEARIFVDEWWARCHRM
jgi:hypothetical protein